MPNVEANLFVAKAMCGGNPAVRRAGTVNIPPPPAIASMKPAKKAIPHRKSHIDRSKTGSIFTSKKLKANCNIGNGYLQPD